MAHPPPLIHSRPYGIVKWNQGPASSVDAYWGRCDLGEKCEEAAMHDTDYIEQQTAEDIEFEITDLDPSEHVGSNTTSWFDTRLLAWQRLPPRRRHWRLASALGVVLLLVTFVNLNKGAFSRPRSLLHSPAVVTLATPSFPQQDGIACLADAAWSPDSQFVAVLGYTQDCPQDEYVPGIVNLYNVHSHHLMKQLHPDEAIRRVLNGSLAFQGRPFGQQPPVSGNKAPALVLFYVHVTWSPDGQRLAFTFEIALQQPLLHGVVLMNSNDTNAQVLLQHQSASAPLYAEWDTQQTGSDPLNASPTAPSFTPAPPALAYHWSTGGTLVPETLLTDNQVPVAPQPGPIGSPAWLTSFPWEVRSEHMPGVPISQHGHLAGAISWMALACRAWYSPLDGSFPATRHSSPPE